MRTRAINYPAVIFASMLLFYAGPAKAEPAKTAGIEIRASLDKTTAFIGDRITYSITVTAPKDMEIELPRLTGGDFSGFALSGFSSSERNLLFRKRVTQRYLLETYTPGSHDIAGSALKYRAKGSDWQELKINGHKLDVKSLLDQDKKAVDIRDIRGPKDIHAGLRRYLIAGLSVLLIGALGLMLYRKTAAKRFRKIPPLPAHVIAFKALAALKEKDYPRKGENKAYYIELSDIIRRYVENRFNIRAPEMTSEEFLLSVRERAVLSAEDKELLRDFLFSCDLVKFARHQPAQKEADSSFIKAMNFVDQTRAREQEAA